MRTTANLRVIFVQMLFALTIGQVAMRVIDLIKHGGNPLVHPTAFLHLILCVIILTSSWVGWQLSQASENSEKINSVFSLQYVILLIDISLVIMYFIIVSWSFEIDKTGNIVPPKVSKAVYWTMIIFLTYFIWDIFTKGFALVYRKGEPRYIKHTSLRIKPVWKRTWPTLLCLLIAIYIYKNMAGDDSINKSFLIYCILIILFFVFRSLKQELKPEYHLQKEQIPDNLQTSDMNFPLPIQEKPFRNKLKKFFIWITPSFLLLIFIYMYFRNFIFFPNL